MSKESNHKVNGLEGGEKLRKNDRDGEYIWFGKEKTVQVPENLSYGQMDQICSELSQKTRKEWFK